MPSSRNIILLCLLVVCGAALPRAALFAVQVTPHIIQNEGTELGLSYDGLEPGMIYVLKRKEGRASDPKNQNQWERVNTVSETAKPEKDTGLKPAVEYSYALFDQGDKIIAGQVAYSEIPNRQITTSAGGSGGTGAGAGSPVAPLSRSLVTVDGNIVPLALGDTVADLLRRARGVLDALVPFIIGLAVFIIIWNLFRYITEAANEEKRAEAKQFILWGIVGVFLMLSFWGFVTILVNTLGVTQTLREKDIPKVPIIESLPTKI